MSVATCIRIPLRDRDGKVRAHATIDAEDAHLADHRWCLNCNGYAVRNVQLGDGRTRTQFLHRTLLGLEHGNPLTGDHINRDRLDNRRANLRVMTKAEQQQNKGSCGGTSQYRGVTWDKINLKWIAQCKMGGKMHYLGHYVVEAEAGAVAAAFRAQHMPYAVESAGATGHALQTRPRRAES